LRAVSFERGFIKHAEALLVRFGDTHEAVYRLAGED
jgi:hypothetical protein